MAGFPRSAAQSGLASHSLSPASIGVTSRQRRRYLGTSLSLAAYSACRTYDRDACFCPDTQGPNLGALTGHQLARYREPHWWFRDPDLSVRPMCRNSAEFIPFGDCLQKAGAMPNSRYEYFGFLRSDVRSSATPLRIRPIGQKAGERSGSIPSRSLGKDRHHRRICRRRPATSQ